MVLVATQVKRRRGTTAENDAFTGAEGEITVDLTNKELRVHTGDNKVGGYGLARKDLENITDEAKNISNWSSNVTNCITNIPQDIKLELNAGTLTLKAGSKVYVPNGAGVFDEITIASDLTTTTNVGGIVFVNSTGTNIYTEILNNVYSGNSAPSASGIWYDTANNLVKYSSDGQTWSGQYSFPVGIVSTSGGQITSIDQVFNGFGYIGSTVFALPGLKGLIPNGRNADGTLKNTEITISNVLTGNVTVASSSHDILLQSSSIAFDDDIYEPNWQFVYKEPENIIVNTGSGAVLAGVLFARCRTNSNTQITSFTPKTAFHAVDYNDSEYMAHQAMPSDRYVDLTLGASGTTYTAPADGYFVISANATDVRSYLYFGNRNPETGFSFTSHVSFSGANHELFFPAKKGQTILVAYDYLGNINFFRFVYAQGAK